MRFVLIAAYRPNYALWFVGVVAAMSGCARWHQPPPMMMENPMAIPAPRCDAVWDQIVDVVDDSFDILSEQRVRQAGDVLTVGRIDTVPQTGSTILEPWREDAANRYERLHGTLQSIRRRAVVQVIPAGNVFMVEMIVYKELEDLPVAEFSTAGQATFRNDGSLVRLEEPVGVQPVTQGWIPLGRDTALEQLMLAKIMERVGPPRGFALPPWMHPWGGAAETDIEGGVDPETLLRPNSELLPPVDEALPPVVLPSAPAPQGPNLGPSSF